MSKLWKSVLNLLTEIGNHSGCHQFPDRSFFIKGYQFPVCARCTGVFIGQVLAVLVGFLRKPISIKNSIFMLLTMGFDWGLQEINLKKSTNPRRLITGILGGLGLFSLYIQLAKKLLRKFIA